MNTANYIPGSYSHLSFGIRCVIFAIGYVLFIAALIFDGWKIKRDKHIKIVMALAFITFSAATVGEFASHFSWSPIIIDISLITIAASLLLIAIVILLRNKRLTGHAFISAKSYIPENRSRRRYGRRRRNRYKLK